MTKNESILLITILFMPLMVACADKNVKINTLSETGTPGAISISPFEQAGLWGYRNARGKVIIPARYIMANAFSRCGLAAVVDQKGWLYINTEGNEVIRPFVFDNGPDYFQDGLARFVQGNKFGFFDESGKIIIAPQFDFAYPFENGTAKVGYGCKFVQEGEHQAVAGGVWKYIDKQGNIRQGQ